MARANVLLRAFMLCMQRTSERDRERKKERKRTEETSERRVRVYALNASWGGEKKGEKTLGMRKNVCRLDFAIMWKQIFPYITIK